MKLQVFGAVVGLAALGSGIAILSSGPGKGPILEATTTAAQVSSVRVDGTCPTPGPGLATAADCPGGMIQQAGYCLCLATKEAKDIQGAVADASAVAPSKQVSLVLCPGPKDHEKQIVTRWVAAASVPKECLVVVASALMPNISMNSVPTGIEKDLETFCAPCKVGPGSWGQCPYCGATYDAGKGVVVASPDGCKAACPVVAEAPK